MSTKGLINIIILNIIFFIIACDSKVTTGKKQVSTSKKYIEFIYNKDYSSALNLYDAKASNGITNEEYKKRVAFFSEILGKYGKEITNLSGHSEGFNYYVVEIEIEEKFILKFIYPFDGDKIIQILFDAKDSEDKKRIPISTPNVRFEKIIDFYQNWEIKDTLYQINTVSFIKPTNDSVGIVAIKIISEVTKGANADYAYRRGLTIAKYAFNNGIVELVRKQINESDSKYFDKDIGVVFWNPQSNYFYFVLIKYEDIIEIRVE